MKRRLVAAGRLRGRRARGHGRVPALARRRARERLDVYFDDGSFVTFVDGSPEAERLLPLARQVSRWRRGRA